MIGILSDQGNLNAIVSVWFGCRIPLEVAENLDGSLREVDVASQALQMSRAEGKGKHLDGEFMVILLGFDVMVMDFHGDWMDFNADSMDLNIKN